MGYNFKSDISLFIYRGGGHLESSTCLFHSQKNKLDTLVEVGCLNLAHFKCAVKTIAKFHAVGLCHKQMLWHTFAQQSNQAQASKSFEDVEVEGM